MLLVGDDGTPSLSSSLVSASSIETSVGHPSSHISQARFGAPDHDDYAPIEPPESVFRHSGWAGLRRRIYKALSMAGESGRRVRAFADCGNTLWLARDGQELSLLCNKCNDRLCQSCQRERQAAVVEGVCLRMIDAANTLRFVTLTLKHHDIPLSVQIDRLISSFKLLRSNSEVAKAIQGGAWFLEVKLDKAGRLWHPHLHCIVEGSYVEQRVWARAWHAVTGDSWIVDVQIVDNPKRRAQYVSKYSTKPLSGDVARNPVKLVEFIQAIKGRRLYQCFGTWSKAVKREKLPPRKLTMVAKMTSLHSDALGGCLQSLVLLHQAFDRWPKLRKAFPLPDGWSPPTTSPP